MSHASDAPNANSDEYNLTELYGYYSVNDTLTDLTFTDVFTEELANVLNVYFSPALIFMGIIGNVLSITVFFKSKLRGQSTSQYLSALAISDTLFLLQLIPPWLKAVRASRVFARDGFCQTFVYFSYVSSAYSSWLVVAFTVERCVAVLYPLRRARMCTVRRARTLIAAVAACCLAVNTPVLLFAVPRGDECNIDCELMEHAARFNVVDTIFSFTLPLTIITVLNIWIMIGVCRLSRARGHLIKDESKSRPRGARRATREHAHLPGRRTRSTLQRSQQRITRMLLIVSSVFVVLNLPAYSMRIVAYANNMSSHEYSGRWAALQQICLLFFNANFGINFFLYCMTGQNFRRALCQTFPCINSIRNVIKSVCCRGPEQHDAPAPPRSSLTSKYAAAGPSSTTRLRLRAPASQVRFVIKSVCCRGPEQHDAPAPPRSSLISKVCDQVSMLPRARAARRACASALQPHK
ncbi:Neuropeptide receptor A18 [Operophtera brumata]|uniref:Neuropeptide receptor A18 n=1 Tax=Operophtera brumata TaxID=104452 RepID=A0A0L7KYL2_OPEBR|nr:Neuropeptide receptor A18 [Operophtera brumata]